MAQPRSFTAGQNDFLLFFTLAFLIFFVITLCCVGIRLRNLVYWNKDIITSSDFGSLRCIFWLLDLLSCFTPVFGFWFVSNLHIFANILHILVFWLLSNLHILHNGALNADSPHAGAICLDQRYARKKNIATMYNPCHFYTLLQFLENPLKNPCFLIADFYLQALLLRTGSKTQK